MELLNLHDMVLLTFLAIEVALISSLHVTYLELL
jgi:hypothetical protein